MKASRFMVFAAFLAGLSSLLFVLQDVALGASIMGFCCGILTGTVIAFGEDD